MDSRGASLGKVKVRVWDTGGGTDTCPVVSLALCPLSSKHTQHTFVSISWRKKWWWWWWWVGECGGGGGDERVLVLGF